jgi:hypothetical protein
MPALFDVLAPDVALVIGSISRTGCWRRRDNAAQSCGNAILTGI